MSSAESDKVTLSDEARSKLMKIFLHPQLAVRFNQSDEELYCRHVLIELKRAQELFNKISADWNSDQIVSLYRDKIKCRGYGNSYLYAFCRIIKPERVVETGVHYGASSAFILQALSDNDQGHLYSIDLPDVSYIRDNSERHHDAIKSGNVGLGIPIRLRKRWTLVIGDAKERLPELLRTMKSIDIFHHDSMHTYEHMIFEYRQAFTKLKGEGLLASDDITWNTAFPDFCKENNLTPHMIGDVGFTFK